jgi:hypothetical protein
LSWEPSSSYSMVRLSSLLLLFPSSIDRVSSMTSTTWPRKLLLLFCWSVLVFCPLCIQSNNFLQTSPSPEREMMACEFSAANSLSPHCMLGNHYFKLTRWLICSSHTHRGTLTDHFYLPQGLQITGRNAIAPSGHHHLTKSSSAASTNEITTDADPQATTSPSPLVLDLTTMSVVIPRKLGPKSEAEKSAAKQLRRAGGACKKHRLGKKRVSSHCPPNQESTITSRSAVAT